MKTCFNINKRTDTRHKWVIALYTKKDCFCIVLENEEEMEDWLKALLELQLGEAIPEGEPVRPNFGNQALIIFYYFKCMCFSFILLVLII